MEDAETFHGLQALLNLVNTSLQI